MRGMSGRRSRRCDLKELFIITNSGSEPVMRVRGLLRSLNYDGRLGLILAGSCVLLLLASLTGEPGRLLLRYDRAALAAGQWWRLVTAHVVHLDVRHALLNDLEVHHVRSEEHTSELQSQSNLVCRLLLEKKKKRQRPNYDDSDQSCPRKLPDHRIRSVVVQLCGASSHPGDGVVVCDAAVTSPIPVSLVNE